MANVSSSNSQKALVPKLRFKGFYGEWEKTTIENIADVIGGGTPDTTKQENWEGNIQWFTPTEVGHKKYVTNSVRTISELGLSQSSAKLLPLGSVLLSSRATVGECSINTIECATNQGFQSLVLKPNQTTEFIYYLALTLKTYFIKHASGSTFLEISNSEVKATPCNIPSVAEQERISHFLSLLDIKIEKQQQLITLLKSYKRGLYNHIFNSKTDQFDKHKLSDFARVYGGYAFDSKTYVPNGLYKVITIGNVTGARYVDLTDTKFIDHIPFDLQHYQRLEMGDIVISMTGNVGRASIVNKKNCLLNQRVAKLEFYNPNYKELIFQILSCGNFTLQMEQQGQGAAQKNIKNSDIENYEFYVPTSLPECKNVALLLSSIDAIIESELHKQQLLSILKSALLQQLFI